MLVFQFSVNLLHFGSLFISSTEFWKFTVLKADHLDSYNSPEVETTHNKKLLKVFCGIFSFPCLKTAPGDWLMVVISASAILSKSIYLLMQEVPRENGLCFC